MGYDHDRIKANARLFYKNNMGNSILSVLIVLGVGFGVGMALSMVTAVPTIFTGVMGAASELSTGTEKTAISAGYVIGMVFVYIIEMAAAIGLYPLTLGLFGWYRKSIFQKTSLGEMFAPYKKEHILSNIGTMLLTQIFTFLWTLLFIVPGIIKSYSYSQVSFIKTENPNIPARRAIELSEIMMNGHKGDLFYLHLSFIGWGILSVFTGHILGIVYVFPYLYSALSFAYLEVKADAIAKGLIDASEFEYAQEKHI